MEEAPSGRCGGEAGLGNVSGENERRDGNRARWPGYRDFDLGGVLIDWDTRHPYRKLFADNEAAMALFLATVSTHKWNRCQDASRSFAEGARLLRDEHPDKAAALIDAYGARYDEMMAGSSRSSPNFGTAARRSAVSPTGRPKPTRRPESASRFCLGFAEFSSRARSG
jgi:hypothetical protein